MKAARLTKLALAVALAVPALALAESNFVTGATPLTATAHLDFQVTIPRIIFLAVGTSNLPARTDNATIDLVTFSVPAANLGDATPIAASSGVVPVRLIGNGGNINLSSVTTGPLSNGLGDTIAMTEISATTSNANLPHPGLAASGTTTTVIAATGKIVDQAANWTFNYANSALVPAGTYGGVGPGTSRVTYTATLP